MRYLPIVRIIDDYGLRHDVTDIGSGPIGIAPYLKAAMTGVDSDLPDTVHPLMTPVRASVLETPFDDRSRRCVISVDMLEHVPPHLRQAAVDELVRIAGRLLIIAVPAGRAAEAHDAEMAALFRSQRGAEYRFFTEHLDNGLPEAHEVEQMVRSSMERQGRRGVVRSKPNASLRLREFVVRRWIRRRPIDKVLWVALTWLSPICARFNGEPAYRTLAVASFSDD